MNKQILQKPINQIEQYKIENYETPYNFEKVTAIAINKIVNEVDRQKKQIEILKRKVTILENKAKDGKLIGTYSYFQSIQEDELVYFLTKFNIGRDDLLKQLETAHDWLKTNSKRYDNYRSFMSNWLRRHYTELTSKQIEQNKIRLEKVNKLKAKLNK